MILAQALLVCVGVYAVIGVVIGCAFTFRGVNTADNVASTAGIGFRLMIIPGSAMLWPLILRLWLRPSPAPQSHLTSPIPSRGGGA